MDLTEQAEALGINLPDDTGVFCSQCQSVPSDLDATWSIAGDEWLHRCRDVHPQAGSWIVDPMPQPIDCSCSICVGDCTHRPGFFQAGEPERAAELVRLSLQDFFAQYLRVDYWEADSDGPGIWLLAPRTTEETGGNVAPRDPCGRCIFLTADDRCGIHDAKPRECRLTDHRRRLQFCERRAIARSWDPPAAQETIRALYVGAQRRALIPEDQIKPLGDPPREQALGIGRNP